MNVPQLRFDGFDGEWKQRELSELLEFKNGINADKDSYGHGTKFINVLDILNNDYILSENIIGSVNATAQQLQTYSVTHGDILFLRSSETREDVGKCNVYLDEEKPSVFGGFVIRGKKIANYSPFFLKTALNNSSARNQISSKAGGSTRYNVGQGILSEVTVKIPEIEEQQKISSFLMLFNQKIEKQQEKIEKLEQFKKGMMQKIFSQELRFKDEDGGEFPEWQLKELKDIADIVGGGTPSTSHEGYWNGNIPWFTPTEISSEKYVSQSKRTISEEGLKKSSAKVLPVGTILLTTRATLGDMAIATVPVTTNQGFQSIIPKENSVSEFIYYLQPQIKKHCLVNASGSTFMEISKSNLETFTTLIPSKKEQIKISSYLSALDSKIEKEEEKLMVLEEQKRGFMWGMFV